MTSKLTKSEHGCYSTVPGTSVTGMVLAMLTFCLDTPLSTLDSMISKVDGDTSALVWLQRSKRDDITFVVLL
jgi:hypothetical protein